MNRLLIQLIAALPRRQTTILFLDGEALVKRGKVRGVLLSELAELTNANNIQAACIRVAQSSVAGFPKFELTFYGIPPSLHQRFRNVWGAHWN
jgi:hypothetical protein